MSQVTKWSAVSKRSKWTRAYYQMIDAVRKNWTRFKATEVGRGAIWLAPRLRHWLWLYLKWMAAFLVGFLVLSYGFMIFLLLICTGNGKAAVSSFTKLTLVAVGLFAAWKLIDRPEVAAMVQKAIK